MPASFTTAGNAQNNHISFNSGYIDFGVSRIVQVENISLTIAWTIADLFVLNSIKPQFKARHTQKVSMTGQVKSFSPTMEMATLGSSNISTVSSAITLDGQPTLLNPVVTLFDTSGNEVQYQFSNALFKSTKLSSKMEDYNTWDFELEAADVVECMNNI